MSALAHRICYEDIRGTVGYSGHQIKDSEAFRLYLGDSVRSRLEDADQTETFHADLRALATTEMASTTLSALMSSTITRQAWEVGEALAECLLHDTVQAHWPWNTERDKRTPKASLPGADLVGFVRVEGQIHLLLGEVKTSSDPNSPPNVMHGRGGMVRQLEQLAAHRGMDRTLLSWLHTRCKGTEYWPMFQEATSHYLRTGGKCVVLYGVLLRDTSPCEQDLDSRAEALAKGMTDSGGAVLQAWYLPIEIDRWPSLIGEGSP